MIRILFLISLPLTLCCYQYQLCIATVFQNEAPYLVEWIEYHRARGVQFFRLYNNNSTDYYQRVLQSYIKNKIVQLIEWPYQYNNLGEYNDHVQMKAFNDAIYFFKEKTKWLALIDVDEFIVPVEEDNIILFLEKNYPQVSGLAINWQTFGTSGIERGRVVADSVFILDSLIKKGDPNAEVNLHCKCIVRPQHVDKVPNPHFCKYIKNHYAVNTSYERVNGPRSSRVEISKIRINHYWTRDEWFFWNIKVPRYMRWGINPGSQDHLNLIEDRTIQRFLPLF